MDFIFKELSDYKKKLSRLKQALKIDDVKAELARLEFIQTQPSFWQADLTQRQKYLSSHAKLLKTLNSYQAVLDLKNEVKVALSLIQESDNPPDASLKAELIENFTAFKNQLHQLEMLSLLSGDLDDNNALLSINSGAGGVEAMDWVAMLSRMYKRWAQERGFMVDTIDAQIGEEAGLKSILLEISGQNAFGLLKNETGVHRLVRISPFDAAKRRHTSFAAVFVSANIADAIEININEADLRIETLRSSGAGGQHVNTTDSAVRITHLPTGLMVKVQKERSQHKNRALAMKILKSQLYQRKLDEKQNALNQQNEQKDDTSFGRQIRSYVLYPYQLVKDHPSEFETGDAKSILDGKLDDLILTKLLAQT